MVLAVVVQILMMMVMMMSVVDMVDFEGVVARRDMVCAIAESGVLQLLLATFALFAFLALLVLIATRRRMAIFMMMRRGRLTLLVVRAITRRVAILVL